MRPSRFPVRDYPHAGAEFELVVREDLPLLLREQRRKYPLIVSELTAWRREPAAVTP